jgi:hypothetical protein
MYRFLKHAEQVSKQSFPVCTLSTRHLSILYTMTDHSYRTTMLYTNGPARARQTSGGPPSTSSPLSTLAASPTPW